MSQQIALSICFLFMLWLFIRERKLHPMTSWALWIALLWIVIIGTKPVSVWLGGKIEMETPAEYVEGNALNRNIYIFLMALGLVALLKRRINWRGILSTNRWVFIFFFYCSISIIWSDYPFVSLKRWIKDIGNVVMVLIILTEYDPVKAFKAVFARFTYFVIPLSVVFIKYVPEFGRYYNRWTWEPAFCGVTTNKNGLGCIAFICGLFLVWGLFEMRTPGDRKTDKVDLLSRVILLLMVFWLIDKAKSATALVCLILGTGILLFARFPVVKGRVRYLGTYSLAVGFLIFLLYSVPTIREAFVGMVGRDTTLTGRTELWAELLTEPINFFLGTGYQSFWLGPGGERMWEKYYFHPIQAHNGYIETYLNGGLIGLFLLIAMLTATGSKLRKELLLGSNYGIIRFSFFVTCIFYNWTEAMFSGGSPVWFILLIAALGYPRLPMSVPKNQVDIEGDPLKACPKADPKPISAAH